MSLLALKQVTNDAAVRKSFDEILGKKAPGFLSSIISCASGNKALVDCDPMSIVRSASIAAVLDLPINPNLGFAWLVPYKGVATFQMGWKGYVQLGQRSGQYKAMNATSVLEGQIKSRNTFTGDFEFQEEFTSEKIQGYLFYFRLVQGFEKYFYMTHPQVEKHAQRYSQSYRKGGQSVWKDDFEAMALKTVTKQSLSKWGPLSIEMQKALTYDGAEVLDLESGEYRYPDNQISKEDSVEKLEELQAEKNEIIPGHNPPQTCQQVFDNLKDDPNGPQIVEALVAQLDGQGHKYHADKLTKLMLDHLKAKESQ